MAEAAFRPHPRTQLDDNFASPIRFSLMAALGDGMELDFQALREILQCGDSPLSKAITHLQAAEYVLARKGVVGGRSRTWVRSTKMGRDAFAAHLQALREIVALTAGPQL
ncbi:MULTISPECIES: transcriptional regulator [unclassified Microbacterium]|uniref:transcriptional regulator n=1 Tax=unclassified Microbacterium TaxID=2609290 RepID=UPI000CFC2BAD|nr:MULTISPECIES: transcriptional regulator [unclassified Microbacterium]PQZ61300.1 ArsR family transcriptional regulator [Microbacterium sp. MYb43]PQZ82511.1 ArsR family transcriptional regulator [Microbacterium sp. MYb40]PRB23788.1 ArsR family transcriptional regulator [Microbacterium sp. MYb54]PRB29683.1 ArsR family transcriptional regulator [Microbacterium sp. MYb50]PRB70958.1 ArsR family transcriptional regulator [Microbacterium sp. MYb24]